MLANRILVVDDDASWQELLRECIETIPPPGSRPAVRPSLTIAGSYAEADALLDRQHFHLAFVDLRLREDARELEGKKLAHKLFTLDEGTSVIIATGHADVNTAITALKEWRVLDFVLKDAWDPGKVAQLVQEGLALAHSHCRDRYESAVDFLRGEEAILPWMARTLQVIAPDAALPRADRRLADFLNALLDGLYPLLRDRAAPEVTFNVEAGTACVQAWSKALGQPISIRFGRRDGVAPAACPFSRAERNVDEDGLDIRGVVYVPATPPFEAYVPTGAGAAQGGGV